jgi:hypothetical protein
MDIERIDWWEKEKPKPNKTVYNGKGMQFTSLFKYFDDLDFCEASELKKVFEACKPKMDNANFGKIIIFGTPQNKK